MSWRTVAALASATIVLLLWRASTSAGIKCPLASRHLAT
jgi:hypothetical protein